MKYVLSLILIGCVKMATAQTGTLVGTVTDAAGHPMAKVKVSLKQHDKEIIQKTNKEGHYYIDQLTKGTYTVTVAPSRKVVYTAKNISIEPRGLNHTYYIFVLSDSGMRVVADKHDPFIADKLKDKKSDKNLENVDGDNIIIYDPNTGQVQQAASIPKK